MSLVASGLAQNFYYIVDMVIVSGLVGAGTLYKRRVKAAKEWQQYIDKKVDKITESITGAEGDKHYGIEPTEGLADVVHGIKNKQHQQDRAIEDIRTEIVTNNGGSTLRDKVDRLGRGQEVLSSDLAKVKEDVRTVNDKVEDAKKEMKSFREQYNQDPRHATVDVELPYDQA